MSLALFLGYFAGFLTTVALVPQVRKTWKTKSADDFSLAMLLIWCAGIVCWIAYGFLLNAAPLILCNLATFIMAGAIIGNEIKIQRSTRERTETIINEKIPSERLEGLGHLKV